jgi:hypothetical protein
MISMGKIQVRDKIACVKQKDISTFHSFRPTEIRAQYRQRAGGESQEGGGGDQCCQIAGNTAILRKSSGKLSLIAATF